MAYAPDRKGDNGFDSQPDYYLFNYTLEPGFISRAFGVGRWGVRVVSYIEV